MTLLFLAALAASVVLFVLYPIFARADEVGERPTADAKEQKSLSEKKERIYEAIKDLDFEYQAGKLSDADYRSVRADFLAQAAEVMARMDELGGPVKTAPPPADEKTHPPPRTEAPSSEEARSPSCPSCAQSNPPGAQFCFRCGAKITTPAECPQCGAELTQEARFCTACGVAIPA